MSAAHAPGIDKVADVLRAADPPVELRDMIAAPAGASADRRRGVSNSGAQHEITEPVGVGAEPAAPALAFETYADLERWAQTAEHPGWLARPVWVADAYGIIGAESKAGKTWAVLDLAVTKAAGGRWLGAFEIERPGPVLAFLGEGGRRKMHRRLAAVAAHHGADPDLLGRNLHLCFRAPLLGKLDHAGVVAEEIAAHRPELVIVDPLYLAARGANGASLYEMGEHLELFQQLAAVTGGAVVIVHHWNQTGSGKGRERFSGAGPAEWGRVTVSMSVESRKEIPKGSEVTLKAVFVGDEIPDREVTVVRQVTVDDPDDLRCPMTYQVAVSAAEARPADGDWIGPTKCMQAVEDHLAETGGEVTASGLPKTLRALGQQWRTVTVATALDQLALEGRLAVRVGPRNGRYFSVTDEGRRRAEERQGERDRDGVDLRQLIASEVSDGF